jgi:hypothetical protein
VRAFARPLVEGGALAAQSLRLRFQSATDLQLLTCDAHFL